jgi:hypothetical protein
MRYLTLSAVALLGMTAMSALAQTTPPGLNPVTGARPGHEPGVGTSLPLSNNASNTKPSNTQAINAPTLPRSGMGADATTHDYLTAARAALAAGRTGQAQQSLEMAETRALDRSVPQSQGATPSDSPLVSQISDAIHAVGSGDKARAMQCIDLALAH